MNNEQIAAQLRDFINVDLVREIKTLIGYAPPPVVEMLRAELRNEKVGEPFATVMLALLDGHEQTHLRVVSELPDDPAEIELEGVTEQDLITALGGTPEGNDPPPPEAPQGPVVPQVEPGGALLPRSMETATPHGQCSLCAGKLDGNGRCFVHGTVIGVK